MTLSQRFSYVLSALLLGFGIVYMPPTAAGLAVGIFAVALGLFLGWLASR